MASEFTVETGVDVPPRSSRRSKFPLTEMAVGDSFLVPAPVAKSVRPNLYATAKRYGIKLVTRISDDGLRVWRVSSDA
jgi:hypothetical protein